MPFIEAQSLSAAEREILLAAGSDLPGLEPLDLVWRPKERQITLYEDEVPVSTCGLLRITLSMGERDWRIGGIGGVVTAPERRRRGRGRSVVAEALRVLAEDWEEDAAMLFCRRQLVPFYEGFGFREIQAPVTILQPEGNRASPVPAMILPFNSAPWPPGPVRVDSLPW